MKKQQSMWFGIGTLLVTLMSSCSPTDNRVMMLDEANQLPITLASYAELETVVNSDITFMIVIGNFTCTCTTTFMNQAVRPFVVETGVTFYYLEFTQILNASNKFGLPVVSPNFPVWGVFEGGELKHYRAYNGTNTSQNPMFESLVEFKSFIEDKVYVNPRFDFISFDAMNDLFEQDERFILYFGRHSCPDCSYAFNSFFTNYLKMNPTGDTIYGFEVEKEGVWNATTGNATVGWTEFKDNYGLSKVINTSFGYSTGFVPTWMVIQPNGSLIQDDPSIIEDMIVVYNDTHVLVDENGVPIRDENNATTPTSQLTRSFFDGTRPLQYTNVNLMAGEGTPFTPTNSRAEYHAQLEPIYTPILEAFFDFYLP